MKRLVASLMVVLAWHSDVPAATLLQWNFTGAAGDETSATSSVVQAGMQNSVLQRDLWLMSNTAGDTFASTGWPFLELSPTNSFLYFDVAPQAGFTASVSSVTFNMMRFEFGGPPQWELRSSVDGYASTLGSLATSNTLFQFSTLLNANPSFQSFTTPITFRLYGFGESWIAGPTGSQGITVDGSVATIPEPAAGGLLLVGLGALLWRRRQR